MRTTHLARGVGLLALFFVTAPGDAAAQDAGAILRTALERYESRVRGIDDYTITYSVMGQEISTHLRKQMVDGHPVFLPAEEATVAPSGSPWGSYRILPQLVERVEHVGMETIDGVQAHGLRIDDFEGLDLDAPPQVQGDFQPRTLTIWIDSGEHLMRRMDMEGVLVSDGQERPLTMTARMLDYRTVEGMPHPFRTTIRVEGALAGSGASEEDLAEAREQLAQLDRQMAEMPEAQRQMMERMMGSQLEQLRKMVQSGAFEAELVVTDLQVNTGS